jgi:hypothetical protein
MFVLGPTVLHCTPPHCTPNIAEPNFVAVSWGPKPKLTSGQSRSLPVLQFFFLPLTGKNQSCVVVGSVQVLCGVRGWGEGCGKILFILYTHRQCCVWGVEEECKILITQKSELFN